jgi:hypothetical protein
MMRKTVILLVTMLCATIFAQEELPKIAVYVTGNVTEDEKSALGTRILAALVNSGRYVGIERSDAFLAEIEREHTKQRSGAIDDGQISELGRQFGVKYICVAAITPVFGAFLVSARIIDVETAQVTHIGESSSTLDNMGDFTWVSDEVVHIMFGGEPRERPITKPKAGLSVGAGGILLSDFGGGRGNVAIPYTGGGAYLFVDVKYAQITVSYSTGGGKWESDKTIDGGMPEVQHSFVSIGVYAKYQKNTVEPSPQINLFPLLGIDYEISADGKFIREDGTKYDLDGEDGRPKTTDLSALWFKFGGGLDFNFIENMHLRAELLYGVRTANAYEGENSRLGHGVTMKIGAGLRF